jgi:hypothetical protein
MKNALEMKLNGDASAPLAAKARGALGQAAGPDLARVNPMTRSALKTRALAVMASAPALALAVLVALSTGGSAEAQEKTVAARVKDTKAAERINYASTVRATGQQMALAICLSQAGVNTEANGKVVADGTAELAKLVAALEMGDESMGLEKEEHQPIISAVRGLNSQWTRFDEQVKKLAAGDEADKAFAYISRQNLNMSYASRNFLVRTMQFYVVAPELLQSYAFTLDIAARERALLMQMAKESCGLATGNTVMGNVKRLQNASRLFDLSLNALKNGFEAAGVITPPTPEIEAALADISTDWAALKPEFEKVNGSGVIDVAKATEIGAMSDALYVKLVALADLYVAASKFEG